MTIPPSELKVYATGESVTVTVTPEWGFRAVAEASRFWSVDGMWYVNRVLVSASHRGNGLGGALLERLKQAAKEQGARTLIVEPGGYGSDPARLKRFYKAHGFEESADGDYLEATL